MLSTEFTTGLNPGPRDHELSQNQDMVDQPADPARRASKQFLKVVICRFWFLVLNGT